MLGQIPGHSLQLLAQLGAKRQGLRRCTPVHDVHLFNPTLRHRLGLLIHAYLLKCSVQHDTVQSRRTLHIAPQSFPSPISRQASSTNAPPPASPYTASHYSAASAALRGGEQWFSTKR
jgi:hypothetical protein